MSLLTEKQIVDLIKMANVPIYLYDKICEWNKKQDSKQVEIDWNDAPKNATKAVLRMHWVTESEGSELWSTAFESLTFERPAPVIIPHPHAAIMAKYAEVAARRVDPWVEFEFKHKTNENWVVFICHPHFAVDYEYRHIGDGK